MLSYEDQETRPEDTQQHSATECTKNKGHWGQFLERSSSLGHWTWKHMRKDRRQTNHWYKLKPGWVVFKPLASAFPLGSILSCSLPALRLFRLEQVGKGTLIPACSKSALSLLHLNNKKERKKERRKKNLQHAKQPQVLTAHLYTFMKTDTTHLPLPQKHISNYARKVPCANPMW